MRRLRHHANAKIVGSYSPMCISRMVTGPSIPSINPGPAAPVMKNCNAQLLLGAAAAAAAGFAGRRRSSRVSLDHGPLIVVLSTTDRSSWSS